MLKEISLGLGAALLVFALIAGYDVTPFIFLLLVGGVFLYMANARGMLKGFGNTSRPEKKQEISFDDIGGQGSAIKELKEALDFIRNHREIQSLGIRPLKGILMTGPPGTGKT
ncbi:hypothetical protein N752_08690 [Desulforamulus aquiferis]|nr:hypothetical protein N752_08690 [Desulforamulus aquiferis]